MRRGDAVDRMKQGGAIEKAGEHVRRCEANHHQLNLRTYQEIIAGGKRKKQKNSPFAVTKHHHHRRRPANLPGVLVWFGAFILFTNRRVDVLSHRRGRSAFVVITIQPAVEFVVSEAKRA